MNVWTLVIIFGHMAQGITVAELLSEDECMRAGDVAVSRYHAVGVRTEMTAVCTPGQQQFPQRRYYVQPAWQERDHVIFLAAIHGEET